MSKAVDVYVRNTNGPITNTHRFNYDRGMRLFNSLLCGQKWNDLGIDRDLRFYKGDPVPLEKNGKRVVFRVVGTF